ncbi:basic secretory protein-like protein [Niabella aurantiaca]|uniref:basic secretory protein-like protein n=1 Tax=Niabella aurantiaca TaxID=379900 RepID=UPI00039CF42D|nr:basic secretory protein-like protein [Niabella aurantiaca]
MRFRLQYYRTVPLILLPAFICMGFTRNACGDPRTATGKAPALSAAGLPDTIRKDGITLVFADGSAGMDVRQKQELIRTFFRNYPLFIKTFNPKAARTVHFKIDSGYTGVAYADAGKGSVCYSAGYLRKHPQDVDVVTHEIMHIIQNYPSGPGWITEGIADYVRHVYGVNNAAAGWALRSPRPETSYTNGYGDAARFFVWLELRVKKGIVKKLNAAMRSGRYTDRFWIKETHKDIDSLWADYMLQPEL